MAMLTVDRYCARPTVRVETLETLARWAQRKQVGESEQLNLADPESVVHLYARGHWLTRYLEETRPGLLKGLLRRRRDHTELESEIAAAYGQEREVFWREIDGALVAHFKTPAPTEQ
jgi:hypothetical protein